MEPAPLPTCEVPPARAAAARLVWDGRTAAAPGAVRAPATPQGRPRLRALLQGAIAGAAGGFFAWRGAPVLAGIAWSLGGISLVAGLLSPHGLYAAIERGLARLGHEIGRLITVLTLVPLYYLFFTVFGRLTRHGRGDRLGRRWNPAAPTYWKRRADAPHGRADFERMY